MRYGTPLKPWWKLGAALACEHTQFQGPDGRPLSKAGPTLLASSWLVFILRLGFVLFKLGWRQAGVFPILRHPGCNELGVTLFKLGCRQVDSCRAS